MARGDRGPRRLEAVPAVPRALHVAEGAGHPLRPHPVRAVLGARRHRLRRRARRRPSACSATTAPASRRCSSASPASCSRPTGEIRTHGRVAALLELGAGFNPELTGRENIFMNASILGLSKRETGEDLRRDRRVRRAREVHRHAGAPLLVGHVRAARVRGRGERRARHPARRRGALGRRRGVPAQVPRPGREVPARGPHDPVRHARGRPRAPHLRPRDRARPRPAWSSTPRPAKPCARSARRCNGAEPTTSRRRARPRAVAVDRSSDATLRVRITDVEIEHPGLLVGRNWLLPNEAMTVRVAYHAVERTDDLLFGISIYDEDGNQLLRHEHEDPRRRRRRRPTATCEACFEFDASRCSTARTS